MKNQPATDDPAVFADLKTYCMFLGYPRSGHSLIGALLDAHPNIIMAHELDVLRHLAAGLDQRQIFTLLLENSQAAQEDGRRWGDYCYAVPNQWQGRFQKLQVIGDKKGGGSLRRLRTEPQLLQRLRDTIRLDIRFVHVVRNPYDNISTMARHRRARVLPLGKCIESYFARCRAFAAVQPQIRETEILTLRYESFVADPARHLEELCRFLGVAAPPDYVRDCAGLVFPSPRLSRQQVAWTEEWIEVVRRNMNEFPFLAGYSYGS